MEQLLFGTGVLAVGGLGVAHILRPVFMWRHRERDYGDDDQREPTAGEIRRTRIEGLVIIALAVAGLYALVFGGPAEGGATP